MCYIFFLISLSSWEIRKILWRQQSKLNGAFICGSISTLTFHEKVLSRPRSPRTHLHRLSAGWQFTKINLKMLNNKLWSKLFSKLFERCGDGEKKLKRLALCLKTLINDLESLSVWMCACLVFRVLNRDAKNVEEKKRDGWECVATQRRRF